MGLFSFNDKGTFCCRKTTCASYFMIHVGPADTCWTTLTPCWPMMTPIDLYWPMVTPFDTHWTMVTHIDPYWHSLTHVDPCWPRLIHVDPRRPMLTHVDPCWSSRPILTHIDPYRFMFYPCEPIFSHIPHTQFTIVIYTPISPWQ